MLLNPDRTLPARSWNRAFLNSRLRNPIAAALLAFAGLYLASRYSYLLFHTLAELFAIVIGWSVFTITWNARSFLKNGYLLVVGLSSGAVAVIDLAHALTYQGMAIFPPQGANVPTQLWIAARYLQALSFAAAPLLLRRTLRPSVVLGVHAVATTLLVGAIFSGFFPECYVEGQGLTPFKRVSEYAICIVLCVSIAALLKNRRAFHEEVLPALIGSIGFTIAAELSFTLYVDVYGFANLLGHFLKVLAFACLYHAIIKTSLTRPYALLLRELKQREERLHAAQAAGRVGSFEWEIETGTISTEGMEAIFGGGHAASFNTMSGWRARVHPEDLALFDGQIAQALKGDGDYHCEYRCLRPDGSIGWVAAGGRIERDGSGKPTRMVGVNVDTTDRRRAEEARRESEERLRTVGDNLPDSVVYQRARDPDGTTELLYVSAGIERLIGVPADEVVRDVESLHRRIVPPHLERLLEAENHSARDLSDIDLDIPVRRGDGTVRWMHLHARPRRLANGRILWDGVQTDVTERREFQAELERQVRERTAKLQEMVGELQHVSYAIVHDMRAPLRAMSGYTSLLEHGTPAERTAYIQRIVAAAARMDAQIRDVLSYNAAVLQEVTRSPVAVLPLLRDIVAMYPNLWPEKADIDLSSQLPVVWANEALLTQCFANLLDNAVKFSKAGVKPRIRVWAETFSNDRARAGESAAPAGTQPRSGTRARVYVEDNGVGISEPEIGRIFGMFERGNHPAAGNGIGLAIVRKVAERMGGTVGVTSEVDKGSRFWVELETAGSKVETS